jgi:molybdopterin synthase sulfur carrier subunit
MVRIEFLGPINKEPIEVEATSLKEVATLLQADEQVSEWLKTSAIAVNNTLTMDREAALNDGDVISLLPPVCGG